MSRSGRVRDVFFFEGDYDFHLQIGDLVALEEIRMPQLARYGFGPEQASVERIANRLRGDGGLVEEIRQVLRLALVGGGMDKVQAHDLVARHLVGGNLLECRRIASAVLSAALVGFSEDPIGDDLGELEGKGEKTRPASPTAESAGRTSTGSARRSGSRRGKSIK